MITYILTVTTCKLVLTSGLRYYYIKILYVTKYLVKLFIKLSYNFKFLFYSN